MTKWFYYAAGRGPDATSIVRLRLAELSVHRPRQWGACWLALSVWKQLQLGPFWADLPGVDLSVVDPHTLYGCHDRLGAHKTALFSHLMQRWRDLFNASFEGLLYDLTSTYFESDLPSADDDKRRFGSSRDKRPDCVQGVIALIGGILTSDGRTLILRRCTQPLPDLKLLLERHGTSLAVGSPAAAGG
jgi:hypothetical protein